MPYVHTGGVPGGILSRRVENFDDLALWVDSVIEREQMRYREIWLQWLKNILAFHGESSKVITEDLRVQRRISPGQEKEIEKIYTNFVLPNVRSTAAKLMRARPILECSPASPDDEDVLAAKCGDQLLKAEWYQQRMDAVDMRRTLWMLLTGTGIMVQCFDRGKGEHVQGDIFQGQIVTTAANPFKVFFEPNREDEVDCRYMIYQATLPRDEILEKYEEEYYSRTGQMLELPLGLPTKTDDIADAFLSVAGVKGTGVNDQEYLPINTMYHLPTKWYPNGRYAIICAKKVLYEGPYPYSFLGRLPVLLFRETLCPWRIYGETATSEVLNAQNRYNRLRNQEDEYYRDNLASKWKLPWETKVRMSALRSRKNCVIRYRGEKEPQREPGLPIPGSIYNSIDLARREIEGAGLSDVSQAQNAQGLTSGRAILALQEQDDVKLSLTAMQSEEVYGRLGQNVLLMGKNFYVEPRKYKMVGQSGAGSLFFFDRADLRNTTDVRCRVGSALPTSKLARQEAVKEQMAIGILGPPGSPEALTRARRMLGQGIADDIEADVSADEYVSERENMVMQQGQPMPVSEVDDHLLHLKSHLRKAKAPGIRDNPPILAVFVDHVRAHKIELNPQSMPVTGQPIKSSATPISGAVATPLIQNEGVSEQQVKPQEIPIGVE